MQKTYFLQFRQPDFMNVVRMAVVSRMTIRNKFTRIISLRMLFRLIKLELLHLEKRSGPLILA